MRQECPIPLRTCLILTLPVVSSNFGVLRGPLVFHHTCVLGKLCLPYLRPRSISERADLDTALARNLFNGREVI